MTIKELRVIYESLWCTKSCIETLACEDYPTTEFEDEDFRTMFYTLNSMCIDVRAKMELLKRKEQKA